MAGQQDGRSEEHEGTGTVVKRRGILAAAGAVVAAIVAKQASQPVLAGSTGQAMTVGGGNDATRVTQLYSQTPWDNSYGTVLQVTSNFSDAAAITGSGSGDRAGIEGTGGLVNGAGVQGLGGASGPGVYGVSSGNSVSKGVYGKHTQNGYGVYGEATTSGGYGVTGVGDVFGVFGVSATGIAVQGQVTGASGNPAVYGVATAGPGTQGNSNTGHGAVGVSGASDGHASLFAFSNRQGGIAVRGSIDPMVRVSPYTFAGVFDGTVAISGSLFIGGNKSAYVKHPDGSHRVLYCVESPESWFEDFGEGTLAGGKAEVKLDPDFAALVDTTKMHVFTEAHDEGHQLAVTTRGGDRFTVAAAPSADAHAAGKKASDLSGTFSYRVVAKRKDIKGERLARFEPPKEIPFDVAKATAPPPLMKPVTSFAVPETPVVTPPRKP